MTEKNKMASGTMVESDLAGPALSLTEGEEERLLDSDREDNNPQSEEEEEIELSLGNDQDYFDEEDENTARNDVENQPNTTKPSTVPPNVPMRKAWKKNPQMNNRPRFVTRGRGVFRGASRGVTRGRHGLHPRSGPPLYRPPARPNFREFRFQDVQDPPIRNEPFNLQNQGYDQEIYKTNQPNPMCFSLNPNLANNTNLGDMSKPPPNMNGGNINGGNNVNGGNPFVKTSLDRHGNFRGREEPGLMLNNLKKEFPNFVKKTENPDVNTIKIESDSDDSDIEMVAVVDKKNKKKYKAIKVEEQEDVKKRIKHGVMVHACYDCLESQIYVSERIRAFYDSRKKEITGKEPMVPPQFMKGRLGAPKFKSLKRTIPDEEIVADRAKRVKSQGNVQVEVTDLPTDWVEEGIDKIRSIANAYGDPAGEIPTEKVYQKGENVFVIVYKQPKYATKMFETLHLRQIDEFIVKVSEPHPIE